MGPSIHLSIPMNTQTPKTVSGSSLFPTDMEFISTLLYCRLSLSLITLLCGKSGYTPTWMYMYIQHTHTLSRTHKCISFFSMFPFILGLIASLTGKSWMHLYPVSSLQTNKKVVKLYKLLLLFFIHLCLCPSHTHTDPLSNRYLQYWLHFYSLYHLLYTETVLTVQR